MEKKKCLEIVANIWNRNKRNFELNIWGRAGHDVTHANYATPDIEIEQIVDNNYAHVNENADMDYPI